MASLQPVPMGTVDCGGLIKDHGRLFFAGMDDLSNEVRLKLSTAGKKIGDE
jgi:hypothetical protein